MDSGGGERGNYHILSRGTEILYLVCAEKPGGIGWTGASRRGTGQTEEIRLEAGWRGTGQTGTGRTEAGRAEERQPEAGWRGTGRTGAERTEQRIVQGAVGGYYAVG